MKFKRTHVEWLLVLKHMLFIVLLLQNKSVHRLNRERCRGDDGGSSNGRSNSKDSHDECEMCLVMVVVGGKK